MPLIDLRCTGCGTVTTDYYISDPLVAVPCPACGLTTVRLLSRNVHSQIDTSIDGADVGKNVQEKNEQLKKIHGAYSYDEANLKERTQKFIEDKMQSNPSKD